MNKWVATPNGQFWSFNFDSSKFDVQSKREKYPSIWRKNAFRPAVKYLKQLFWNFKCLYMYIYNRNRTFQLKLFCVCHEEVRWFKLLYNNFKLFNILFVIFWFSMLIKSCSSVLDFRIWSLLCECFTYGSYHYIDTYIYIYIW